MRAYDDLLFNRIDKELRIPKANIHYPKADTEYIKTWNSGIRCALSAGDRGM